MAQLHPKPELALIVEDEPAVRELAVALLEEFPLHVAEVDSAEAALAFMQEHGGEVALIFADVRLSGPMSGIQMATAVCQLWPRVRVVLTTGDPDVALDGLPACVTFLPKPWRALDVLVQAQRAVSEPFPAVS
jgi:CheY-like chemotaxis protein